MIDRGRKTQSLLSIPKTVKWMWKLTLLVLGQITSTSSTKLVGMGMIRNRSPCYGLRIKESACNQLIQFTKALNPFFFIFQRLLFSPYSFSSIVPYRRTARLSCLWVKRCWNSCMICLNNGDKHVSVITSLQYLGHYDIVKCRTNSFESTHKSGKDL
jgi:hypothetical protein